MKLKRRTFIAIILTAFSLLLTKNLWLVVTPIKIAFNLNGVGKYEVTILLNKKYDNDFKNVFQTSEILDLLRTSKVYVTSNNRKIKKVKIVFNKLGVVKENELSISKINFKGGELKEKLNFKKFSADGAKIVLHKDKLALIPLEDTFSIMYEPKLSLRTSYKFEIEIFLIISILSYFLFAKLSNYVADYKSIRNKSRVEILFLVAFFIILFIPMMHISQNEKSKYEKRFLAKYKSLFLENGALNTNFGNDFNSWFNDRFFLRDKFIIVNNSIKQINQMFMFSSCVYDKKYNLLYTKLFRGLKYPTDDVEKEKKKYLDKLSKFSTYCKERNIKLYMLVVPRKCEFFEFTPIELRNEKKDFSVELIDYLRKNSDLKIIFPFEPMLEANKETPVYFSTDHHWTKKGTFVGYLELMKEIKKDFKNIQVLKEADLVPYKSNLVSATWNHNLFVGRTLDDLRLSENRQKKLLDKEYLYYKNPLSKNLEIKKLEFNSKEFELMYDDDFYYPSSNNLKALVIGNSFAQNLVEFLPYSFKRTVRLLDNNRKFNMDFYNQIIEEYKPDIIILNFQSWYFETVLNMYKKK